MYIVENKTDRKQKGKTTKADKVLFQLLLVAKDAGREIDLKKLLCHELSPVPLAIADTAGHLQYTNNAAFGKLLVEDVNVDTLPTAELKICTIVDGQALVQAMGKPTGSKTFGSDVHILESTHEEADTRIIIHATAACEARLERIVIVSRDTDVLVLVIHFAAQLSRGLWKRTGAAKQQRFIAVHDIQLPPTLRRNIPADHALTGCDTVSQLRGHGKKSTWKTFQKHAVLLHHLGPRALSEAT